MQRTNQPLICPSVTALVRMRRTVFLARHAVHATGLIEDAGAGSCSDDGMHDDDDDEEDEDRDGDGMDEDEDEEEEEEDEASDGSDSDSDDAALMTATEEGAKRGEVARSQIASGWTVSDSFESFQASNSYKNDAAARARNSPKLQASTVAHAARRPAARPKWAAIASCLSAPRQLRPRRQSSGRRPSVKRINRRWLPACGGQI